MTLLSGQPLNAFDAVGYSAASCGQPGKIKTPEGYSRAWFKKLEIEIYEQSGWIK